MKFVQSMEQMVEIETCATIKFSLQDDHHHQGYNGFIN